MPPPIIQPLESEAVARQCAAFMAASEPWLTLGRGFEDCLAVVSDASRERYVAHVGDALAGLIILDMRGAFVGYIQTICVAPECRGEGIGSALIAFAEELIFALHPNVFLCVSSFNTSAQRLYEHLGYVVVGRLTDYVAAGYDEILLRKSRGPLAANSARVIVASPPTGRIAGDGE